MGKQITLLSHIKTSLESCKTFVNNLFTTVADAIEEMNEIKQDKSDNNLQTTDKTVVGAINELSDQMDFLSNIDTSNVAVWSLEDSEDIEGVTQFNDADLFKGNDIISINDGGTGATTANAALNNLGAMPKEITDNLTGHKYCLGIENGIMYIEQIS